MFEIQGLHVEVEGTEILKGVDLTILPGQVAALMGPNGSGKSTLAHVIMGKPGYEVLGGTITLDGADVLAMSTPARALAGLHLVMQYPTEVPGVRVLDALAEAFTARGRSADGLDALLRQEAASIGLEERFLERALNVDLSGGEKKRNETLQLAALRPRMAILDELDSGLDIDALRDCSRRVEALTEPHEDLDGNMVDGVGVLAITHYSRLLRELRPDVVHVLVGGRIVAAGGPELADTVETDGYAAFAPELAEQAEGSSSALDDLFAPPG